MSHSRIPFVLARVGRRSRSITLVIAAAMALCAAGAPTPTVVRVGIINDQNGPLSDLAGSGSIIAAKLAIEDFQQTAPSFKIELVTADHQNKPDLGAQIVRKWFDSDGVDMVADIGNSAVALAVQTIAHDRNKIVAYAAVGTSDISGKQCTPTGLVWLHDSYNLLAGSVGRLVTQGYDSWYFIAADYAFGKDMVTQSQRMLAAAGGRSVGAVFHPVGTTDYAPYLLQAQASGSKIVAFANAGQQLVSAMKQWNEFGMGAAQKPVALLMFLTDVHGMGLETAQGLTTVTAWYWDLDDETRAFAARFFKLHGTMPTAPQASVYSAVGHYLKAVAATGSIATDIVLAKMRSMPIDDFFARGAMLRADGRLVHDFYLVQVKTPSELKHPWAYYNIIAKIPARDANPPLSQSECPLLTAADRAG